MVQQVRPDTVRPATNDLSNDPKYVIITLPRELV